MGELKTGGVLNMKPERYQSKPIKGQEKILNEEVAIIESLNPKLESAFVKKYIANQIKGRKLLVSSEGTREAVRILMANYYYNLCNKIEYVAKEIAKRKTVTVEMVSTAYNLLYSRNIFKTETTVPLSKAFQKKPLAAEIKARNLLIKSGTFDLINTILYSFLIDLVNSIEKVTKKKTVSR